MKRTDITERIIITVKEGKLISVYELADPELDIEVRLEEGVDYSVWEL